MSALPISELPIPSRQRPHLFLLPDVQPVRPTRLPETIYWKRRAAAVGVAILAMMTVYVVAGSVSRVVDGGSPAAQQSAAVSKVNQGPGWYWTVRPGDTLWSIAQAVHPQGDIRPVIDQLRSRYGSTPLTPGMNLLVS